MSDLRKRLLFVLMAIIVYRIGTYIPVPGINPEALSSFFEEQSGTIIDMFNMFSGGAVTRMAIFALGIAKGNSSFFSSFLIILFLGNLIPTVFKFAQARGLILELFFFFTI